MATTPSASQPSASQSAAAPPLGAGSKIIYPSRDGRPIGETPIHRRNLASLIEVLERRYADDADVYVSGNMLMYYIPEDNRRHVSPDVFLVRGVAKNTPRDYYLVWEEGHAPDLVIELTSASTRNEDVVKKHALYRDVIQVREYILFDPRGEYLDPPLQGYRLIDERYVPIVPVAGRLPSEVIGAHFEASGENLRIYDPAIDHWLPTFSESLAATEVERERAETERKRAETERKRAETERKRAETERKRAEAEWKRAEAARQQTEIDNSRLAAELGQSTEELERLRQELERLRRLAGDRPDGSATNS
jgi:Uma2 family endonuclease